MSLKWPAPQPDATKANTGDADIRTVLVQEYGDHGQWARHYSTVRMTVGTFFITAATGFISLRWDTPQGGIALISAVIFGMGVILFLIFSALTFDEMNKQREIVDTYSEILGLRTAKSKKLSLWKSATGLVIVIALVLAFASFDLWWCFYSKPQLKGAAQITVPLKLQVGQQPVFTVNVPVKVLLP
jgi:hypothetical protein